MLSPLLRTAGGWGSVFGPPGPRVGLERMIDVDVQHCRHARRPAVMNVHRVERVAVYYVFYHLAAYQAYCLFVSIITVDFVK